MVTTPINRMLEKVLGTIARFISQPIIDRLEDKFVDTDRRLDSVERIQAEHNVRILANREIALSDNEALEQKYNSIKSGQEMILDAVNVRLLHINQEIKEVKQIILKG